MGFLAAREEAAGRTLPRHDVRGLSANREDLGVRGAGEKINAMRRAAIDAGGRFDDSGGVAEVRRRTISFGLSTAARTPPVWAAPQHRITSEEGLPLVCIM